MASGSDYVINVSVTADTSGFTGPLDDASSSFSSFAETAGGATSDIASSVSDLGTSVGPEIASAGTTLGQVGGTSFGNAATAIEQKFGTKLKGAFKTGNYLGAIESTLMSLTPALGAVGIAIGAAVGIGAAIVHSVTSQRAELVKALNDTYKAAEAAVLKGETGIDKVIEIMAGLTPEQEKQFEAAGLRIADVVHAIQAAERGRLGPLRAIETYLKGQSQWSANSLQDVNETSLAEQATADQARAVLKWITAQEVKAGATRDAIVHTRQVMKDLALYSGQTADSFDRVLNSLTRINPLIDNATASRIAAGVPKP